MQKSPNQVWQFGLLSVIFRRKKKYKFISTINQTNVYNYTYILHVQYTAHVCVSVWRRALLYTGCIYSWFLVCTSKRASIYHCLCLTFYIRFRLATFYQRVCGLVVYVYVFVYVHWNVCVCSCYLWCQRRRMGKATATEWHTRFVIIINSLLKRR